jgi:zinc transport system substrate-binding protein
MPSLAIANERSPAKEIALLASIKPLQLIVQAVVGDQQRVDVLVPPGMSIHDYALRPSDRLKIERADLIIWLGPKWEHYLPDFKGEPVTGNNTISQPGKSFDVSQLSVPDTEMAGNGHYWLSPALAKRIAIELADKMQLLNPQAGARYQQNLDVFMAKLALINVELKKSFAQKRDSYLVYHNAYPFFEVEYGLAHAAVISEHHGVMPGARHLLALRHVVESENVRCFIVEPESNLSIVQVVSKGFDVRVQMLDPMATEIPSGTNGYLTFLTDIGEKFRRCLGDFPEK